eukprot:1137015-Pelagomonas_calceolata.AAC.4
MDHRLLRDRTCPDPILAGRQLAVCSWCLCRCVMTALALQIASICGVSAASLACPSTDGMRHASGSSLPVH